MRGRTWKHFFFLSEFNECYVPGTVLNSLARAAKTLYRKNRTIVLCCVKRAWDAAFPLFSIDLWAGEESAVPFENVKFEVSNRQLEKRMGPWAQEKCLLLWHRFGKRWVSGGSRLITNLSGAEETPAKATEEGAESFEQEGRGASKRLKRRGRRTRREVPEGRRWWRNKCGEQMLKGRCKAQPF